MAVPSNFRVRRNGVWVIPSAVYVRVAGVWRAPSFITKRVAGAWSPVPPATTGADTFQDAFVDTY